MITLALDSTAKCASAAIYDGEKILASFNVDNGLTQSELLLPMVESLCKTLNLDFSDINLFACSVGPGSFTGVRIGVSVIKGLCFGRNTPCVPVSTLEALAHNLEGIDGIIVATMDARRNQFYSAIFDSEKNKMTRLTDDMAISSDALCDAIKNLSIKKPVYLVGDGYAPAKKKLTEAGIVLCETPPLLILENAATIARIAERKYLSGEYVSDKELLPTYLRLPQAERERLEKQTAEK